MRKFFAGFMLGLIAGAAGGFIVRDNKNRIKAKLWKLRIKAEIQRQLLELDTFTRASYFELIEDALEEYRGRKELASELEEFEDELKSRWREAKQRFVSSQSESDDEEDAEE